MRIAVGSLVLSLVLAAVPVRAGEAPAWVAKVPGFRSEWPEPLPIGSAVPEFSLLDVWKDRRVELSKARKGKRATLLLFLDDNCGTCRHRAADLGESLTRCVDVEGTAVLAVFVRNLRARGDKAITAFAETAKFPDVPLLKDDTNDTAEVTLAYRVAVSPTAVVLDAEGRLAYFGLALARKGADLLPGIVDAVAAGRPLDGPAVRTPYG
jgi:peroxiredoxin